MIGRTLALYFAFRFAKTVLAIFMLFVILIAAATYIDIIDRAFSTDNFDTAKAALVVLLRLPSYSEDALPFAVLFGSMAAFVSANRQLEVVIARAAGLSGWQFLLPAIGVGLLFGVAATTIYSPLSSMLLTQANSIKAQGMLDIGRYLAARMAGPCGFARPAPTASRSSARPTPSSAARACPMSPPSSSTETAASSSGSTPGRQPIRKANGLSRTRP